MRKRYLTLVGFVVVFSFLIYFRSFESWELGFYDVRLKLRSILNPVDTKSLPIVFVQIDDKTLATKGLNQFPFPRKYYAAIIDVLKQFGAKQIVFDILFAEPTDDDTLLASAIKSFGRVYLPYSISLSVEGNYQGKVVRILPIFSKLAYRKGYITVLPDKDGKRRKIPLRLYVSGKYIYHLSFESAVGLLGLDPIRDLENTKTGINLIETDQMRFKVVHIPLYKGKFFYLDYPGKWTNSFNKVSFVDLVKIYQDIKGKKPLTASARKLLEKIRGAMCVIGLTATGSYDLAPTPLEPSCPMVMTYGVVAQSLLENRFINRLSSFIPLIIFLITTIVLSLWAKNLLQMWVIWGTIISLYVILNIGLFVYRGLWLDIVGLLIGSFAFILVQSFFSYIDDLKEKQRVEQEMALASDIQSKMLPDSLPKINGLDCQVYFSPAVFVAGDFYDVWKSRDKLRVFMGDVSGKGVSAALYVAQTVTVSRVLRVRFEEKPINKLLEEVNKFLSRFKVSGVYATACMAEIDTEKFCISDAGHLAVWVYRAENEQIEQIKLNKGAPLGIDRWSEYDIIQLQWREGDVILLFSDGLLEARREKEFIDENILRDWIRDNINSPICNIDALFREFYRGKEQSDDITLLVIRNVSGQNKEA